MRCGVGAAAAGRVFTGFDVSTFDDCGVAAQGSSWYVTLPRLSAHLVTAAAQGSALIAMSAASSETTLMMIVPRGDSMGAHRASDASGGSRATRPKA